MIGDLLNQWLHPGCLLVLFFNCTPATGMTWGRQTLWLHKFRKFDLKHENPTYPHEGGFALSLTARRFIAWVWRGYSPCLLARLTYIEEN